MTPCNDTENFSLLPKLEIVVPLLQRAVDVFLLSFVCFNGKLSVTGARDFKARAATKLSINL